MKLLKQQEIYSKYHQMMQQLTAKNKSLYEASVAKQTQIEKSHNLLLTKRVELLSDFNRRKQNIQVL